jgi:tRNA pseudouridine55 synthase
MFGLLNLNKPPGCTSRDVVNRIQKLVRPQKIGHAGTLDPLATGVLVVAIGGATRLVEYIQQQSKSYLATFQLGRSSDTEDIEGKIAELDNPPQPTCEQIGALLPQFTGEIEQVPPAFSALKVAGQRAYALARRGQEVELAARPIVIHRLQLVDYSYPTLRLEIACSSGTYVRSLGRDLAKALGTEAVMSGLVRTSVGPFAIGEAVSPDDLTRDSLRGQLQPAAKAVGHLKRLELDHAEVTELLHGRAIQRSGSMAAGEIAAFDPRGELVAILGFRDGKLWPTRVFATQ